MKEKIKVMEIWLKMIVCETNLICWSFALSETTNDHWVECILWNFYLVEERIFHLKQKKIESA